MGAGFFTSSFDAPKYDFRHAFHKYCREHRVSQQRSRDSAQQAFFAYVSQERGRFFDSQKELYLDVLLRDHHGKDRGCLDFVQEGLIAKLHIINEHSERSTLKRERSRKNAKLATARHFLEDHYKVPLRAIRIDGTYNGKIWTATAVQVSPGDLSRKL
jgi:hypothetical protein